MARGRRRPYLDAADSTFLVIMLAILVAHVTGV